MTSDIGKGFRRRPVFDFKAEAQRRGITEKDLKNEIMNMGLEVYREEYSRREDVAA